ncbi:MAG: DNA-processing protein DprA [Gammaproteobacteria bacterium]|nr:DNA-processing protein DprA [Gammaproteobacteria bacterium]
MAASIDWLRLGLARGLHGHRFEALLDHFGDIAQIVRARARELQQLGLTTTTAARIVTPDSQLLADCEAWLSVPGQSLVTWCDSNYPTLLREIRDPPVLLFVRGEPAVLQQPQLAIVGSRNASAGGLENARRFAGEIAAAGFCITSGMAHGVDGAAHRGALDRGGLSIAVCGTGPDVVYPATHCKLATRIARSGAVVTEFPVGTGARPHHFPARNRLIAGMSVGTLVVEAGRRSGALITARLAASQGREVFAIPGSIHNPVARGCHHLIRQGAKLVERVEDIGEELGPLLGSYRESIEQNTGNETRKTQSNCDDPQYRRLLRCLGWDPVNTDELVARSGLTAAEVSSMLLILELEDRVQPLAGGRFLQREEGAHDERDRA